MSEDLKQPKNEGEDFVIKEDGDLVSGEDYRDREYSKKYGSEVSEKTSSLEEYRERLITKVDEILVQLKDIRVNNTSNSISDLDSLNDEIEKLKNL